MLGTIVNTATIILGTSLGALLKKGVKPQYQEGLYNAMGFCAVALGLNAFVQHLPKSEYPVLFILCLAVGSLIGYALRLADRFETLVARRENVGGNCMTTGEKRLADGLSTGILLYCVGTLSMLGPVVSALQGDNTYLFTNATLDFVTSMVLASTYGWGDALGGAGIVLVARRFLRCGEFVGGCHSRRTNNGTLYRGRHSDLCFGTFNSWY